VDRSLTSEEQDMVYRWLAEETRWAKGLPRSVFDRSLAGSLCFALRDASGALKGFARLVTDKATFAYLCDLFVDSAVRGQGGGKALIAAIMADPELQNLRRWLLVTRDAHELYARHGFTALTNPERFMQRHDADVYARSDPLS
jgi:N-acetylglutamate synthase-like GNAT family acetyltransferase